MKLIPARNFQITRDKNCTILHSGNIINKKKEIVVHLYTETCIFLFCIKWILIYLSFRIARRNEFIRNEKKKS